MLAVPCAFELGGQIPPVALLATGLAHAMKPMRWRCGPRSGKSTPSKRSRRAKRALPKAVISDRRMSRGGMRANWSSTSSPSSA